MFKAEDIITCKSYQKLADYIYEASTGLDNIPASCVIWTSNDHLDDLFKRVRGNNEKYIVISSYSDFGLDYQVNDNPTKDMQRYFDLVKYQYPQIGYNGITIPPMVNKDRCNPNDKYILKCYRFSHSSFNDIPNEIQHIFMVNNCIQNPKITSIPFGVFEGHEKYFSNIDIQSIQKEHKIYINFANYTLERTAIKEKLKEEISKNTKIGKSIILEENTISFEEYLSNIKKYLFILSLSGNGKDTFRNLESIYCGSFPILPEILDGIYGPYCIPYSLYDDVVEILTDSLNIKYRPIDMFEGLSGYDIFKLSYWKDQINKARELL